MTAAAPLLCRSALYMPAANARALEKARGLDADCLIFDLEDAVAPDAKETARAQLCDALAAGGYGDRLCVARVNGAETPWGRDDLEALAARPPDAVLFPKISHPDDLTAAAQGLPEGVALWAMIETPQAILHIEKLAARTADTPLACFVLGTNDLAKELRTPPSPDRAALLTALSLSVLAARAHGLCVIDGVFNDIADTEGFAAECRQGAMLGFDGKTLIHPDQLAEANRVFAPDAEEIVEAKAILAAFEMPENAGQGVITVEGKMVELLHRDRAAQLVARAAAIEARR